MKNRLERAALLTLGGSLMSPAALWAHPGHPWIEGAAEPLLGLDHFLAAMLVVVSVTVGLMAIAKRKPAGEKIGRKS